MSYVIKVEDGIPIGRPLAFENFLHLYPDTEISNIQTVGYAEWVPSSRPPYPEKSLTKLVEGEIPVWDEELQVYKQVWTWIPLEGDELQQKLDQQWNFVREKQKLILHILDDIEQNDGPFASEVEAELVSYRQALMNVFDNLINPFEIKWPRGKHVTPMITAKKML